ncbi:type III pantothenate kinase [Adhaeribacter radiodurans]|uniref:Type III pantothenate kinase n=1 Tax=Adhaeribacter radiodurans TaxID=2745197 RepID=A0A7L7LFJ8_9BACT|nr:type III pantothenate kinase [Adhaeribacter radiodurans]QMU31159.1 type III pantothenate kinase [Adhaeribacter radiodurans]
MNQIAIDVGNTRIKYGIFNGQNLLEANQVQNLPELADKITQYKVHNGIISSVRHLKQEFLPIPRKIIWLTPDMSVPITNNYGTPQTLGMDRLAAVTGASFLFPDQDCLVIDAGTCITFDFINREATYDGGSISPGLDMKFKALHTFTGKLPLVEQAEKDEVPLTGRNTIECLKSGVLNGTLAEVEGIIKKYKQQFPNLITVVCGGDASFFEKNIKASIFVVPELVLIGLNRILNYNV